MSLTTSNQAINQARQVKIKDFKKHVEWQYCFLSRRNLNCVPLLFWLLSFASSEICQPPVSSMDSRRVGLHNIPNAGSPVINTALALHPDSC